MEKEFQDLFQIRHNDDRVEVGKVLIAEPFLEGKYFNRSVVYMVEHDPSGSVGFVLNKPLPYTTSELVKELEGVYFPVYIGGPVERNQLYYIHRRNDIPDSEEIAKGIYWGGDFKALTEMLKAGRYWFARFVSLQGIVAGQIASWRMNCRRILGWWGQFLPTRCLPSRTRDYGNKP